MLGDARNFNNMETRVIIKLFPGKPREIHAITERSMSGKCIIVCHCPKYVALFKRGDFSTCVAPRLGRPKTVMTPEFIDKIRELILEDRQISA